MSYRLASRPLDIGTGRVELTHGSGGRAMAQLVAELFAAAFSNPYLSQGNDQALLPAETGRLALATDSYVISPLFFPGGCIGDLAVNGTINDLAMGGAVPRYLTASFILEEGLPLADLARIVQAMADTSREAGVPIVTGDTKVVERGKADGCFITTSGVGVVPEGLMLGGDRARPGDVILISGSVGDHGVAVLGCRQGLGLDPRIASDSAALHGLVSSMLASAEGLRLMRDPTRGGVATTLNELAVQSGVGMVIEEASIPMRPEVAAACEILGLDPLYVANEGKLIAICAPEAASDLLGAMRAHPLGREAAIIGTVVEDPERLVRLKPRFGGERALDWLRGLPLPRIC